MKASIYFLAKSRRTPEVSPRTSFYTVFVRHPATAPLRENSTGFLHEGVVFSRCIVVPFL